MTDLDASIRSIEDVVARQLCTGCGVCAYVRPDRYAMDDAPRHGRRPRVLQDAAADPDEALAACPGPRLEHEFDAADPELVHELIDGWGPVYEVWEGYAADPEIRSAGSSGGAITALALHALEAQGMRGVLHVAARADKPHLNETVLSTTRGALLAATGSRYAPASPCDGLARVEAADGPCVMIGKPCDVAAVQRARRLRPALDRNVGLLLAFFCAGTPSTEGNLALLRKAGVENPDDIVSLRYRGNGWPGLWSVKFRAADGSEQERSMTYAESWGFLQSYRQWRCYVCPDHTGEFADIALGDPWYRPVEPGEQGKSLLIARTRRGRAALHAAAAAGYIVLETCDRSLLPRSQPNLLETRGALWGRLFALRVAGAAVPRYRGFPSRRFWWSELTPKRKLQSVFGTLKRVGRKRLAQRVEVEFEDDPGGRAGGRSH